ncbi:MAG: hypothetical protein HY724_07965, partial [Candidatus Rokubacteria bacterium]|nr:hypothetical protein [Candidatus Rokubacteria bacterium]
MSRAPLGRAGTLAVMIFFGSVLAAFASTGVPALPAWGPWAGLGALLAALVLAGLVSDRLNSGVDAELSPEEEREKAAILAMNPDKENKDWSYDLTRVRIKGLAPFWVATASRVAKGPTKNATRWFLIHGMGGHRPGFRDQLFPDPLTVIIRPGHGWWKEGHPLLRYPDPLTQKDVTALNAEAVKAVIKDFIRRGLVKKEKKRMRGYGLTAYSYGASIGLDVAGRSKWFQKKGKWDPRHPTKIPRPNRLILMDPAGPREQRDYMPPSPPDLLEDRATAFARTMTEPSASVLELAGETFGAMVEAAVMTPWRGAGLPLELWELLLYARKTQFAEKDAERESVVVLEATGGVFGFTPRRWYKRWNAIDSLEIPTLLIYFSHEDGKATNPYIENVRSGPLGKKPWVRFSGVVPREKPLLAHIADLYPPYRDSDERFTSTHDPEGVRQSLEDFFTWVPPTEEPGPSPPLFDGEREDERATLEPRLPRREDWRYDLIFAPTSSEGIPMGWVVTADREGGKGEGRPTLFLPGVFGHHQLRADEVEVWDRALPSSRTDVFPLGYRPRSVPPHPLSRAQNQNLLASVDMIALQAEALGWVIKDRMKLEQIDSEEGFDLYAHSRGTAVALRYAGDPNIPKELRPRRLILMGVAAPLLRKVLVRSDYPKVVGHLIFHAIWVRGDPTRLDAWVGLAQTGLDMAKVTWQGGTQLLTLPLTAVKVVDYASRRLVQAPETWLAKEAGEIVNLDEDDEEDWWDWWEEIFRLGIPVLVVQNWDRWMQSGDQITPMTPALWKLYEISRAGGTNLQFTFVPSAPSQFGIVGDMVSLVTDMLPQVGGPDIGTHLPTWNLPEFRRILRKFLERTSAPTSGLRRGLLPKGPGVPKPEERGHHRSAGRAPDDLALGGGPADVRFLHTARDGEVGGAGTPADDRRSVFDKAIDDRREEPLIVRGKVGLMHLGGRALPSAQRTHPPTSLLGLDPEAPADLVPEGTGVVPDVERLLTRLRARLTALDPALAAALPELTRAVYANSMRSYAAIVVDTRGSLFLLDEHLQESIPAALADALELLLALLSAHEAAQFDLRKEQKKPPETYTADLTEELALFAEVDRRLWQSQALTDTDRQDLFTLAAHLDAQEQVAPQRERFQRSLERLARFSGMPDTEATWQALAQELQQAQSYAGQTLELTRFQALRERLQTSLRQVSEQALREAIELGKGLAHLAFGVTPGAAAPPAPSRPTLRLVPRTEQDFVAALHALNLPPKQFSYHPAAFPHTVSIRPPQGRAFTLRFSTDAQGQKIEVTVTHRDRWNWETVYTLSVPILVVDVGFSASFDRWVLVIPNGLSASTQQLLQRRFEEARGQSQELVEGIEFLTQAQAEARAATDEEFRKLFHFEPVAPPAAAPTTPEQLMPEVIAVLEDGLWTRNPGYPYVWAGSLGVGRVDTTNQRGLTIWTTATSLLGEAGHRYIWSRVPDSGQIWGESGKIVVQVQVEEAHSGIVFIAESGTLVIRLGAQGLGPVELLEKFIRI